MATNRTQLNNNQILTPLRDLEATELQPFVKDKRLGKYVFLYDYETTIYTNQAKTIMAQSKGNFTLPANSSFNLKYSKGDVVDVVSLGVNNNGVGLTVNGNLKIIDVPKFVKPLCTSLTVATESCPTPQSYSPTITIDSSLVSLKKVADSTPLTFKFGVNFGKNPNPKIQPVYNNTQTPKPKPTPIPNPTPTPTDRIVVVNGMEDTTETKSFFDDKNNLLMIAGVLLIGYLLLNDKSE